MAHQQTHRNPVEFASLREQVWQLRLRGLSGTEIAPAVNVPQGTVYRWLKEMGVEAASRARETASSVLELELERIDRWQANLELQLEEQVASGKTAARTVEVLSKLSERRAKLLGMDKPTQIDATVHEVTEVDVALMELIREAKAASALEERAILELDE